MRASLFILFVLYGSTRCAAEAPTRAGEIAQSLPATPCGIGPPISDRAAWNAVANSDVCRKAVARAEQVAAQPVPELNDDLYREFGRSGNRSKFESVTFDRRARFMALVLAECGEDRGRFLPKIVEYLNAFCAERTWVWPAHDKGSVNFDGKAREIDLGTAEMGWLVATARWLLAERLAAPTNELVSQNVMRRVVEPYVTAATTGNIKPIAWAKRTNNWNAVCHAGVVGATLATAADRDTRATVIASAERYTQRFLDGFGPDGYCSEGLGYWNYGFGHYILLAETVRQATGGRVDLMDRPGVRKVAMFGSRIQIMSGVVPAFADCSIDSHPAPEIGYYADARFGPAPAKLAALDVHSGRAMLYDVVLYTFLDPATLPKLNAGVDASNDSPLRTWFDSAGVLIARPAANATCRIGVALKGGNNAESHNHNDIGSFVVVRDDQPVLLDPGTERYTARTFGPHRYESKLLNSFGHSVPVVAGQLQRTGAEAHAKFLNTEFTDDVDTLVMDLTSAYAVPELKRLERTFVYDRRKTGSLTVTDHVEFQTPQSFGTALITLGQLSGRDGDAFSVVDGKQTLRVHVDTGGAAYSLGTEEIHEDAPVTPRRIGINLDGKTTSATVSLQITAP